MYYIPPQKAIFKPVRAFFLLILTSYHLKQRKSFYGLNFTPFEALSCLVLKVELWIVLKLLLPLKVHSVTLIGFYVHTETPLRESYPDFPKTVARSVKYPLLFPVLCLTQFDSF